MRGVAVTITEVVIATFFIFVGYINYGEAQSMVKKFAYEAIVPTGSYDYLKAVKGTIYPYQGSNAYVVI